MRHYPARPEDSQRPRRLRPRKKNRSTARALLRSIATYAARRLHGCLARCNRARSGKRGFCSAHRSCWKARDGRDRTEYEAPATRAPLVVGEVEQLPALLRSNALYSKQPLIFALAPLAPQENFAFAERLNQYRQECGCSLGAKCMAASLILSAAWVVDRSSLVTLWWQIPVALAAALLCAGAGKAVGIARARRKLRREVNFFLKSFPEHQRKE